MSEHSSLSHDQSSYNPTQEKPVSIELTAEQEEGKRVLISLLLNGHKVIAREHLDAFPLPQEVVQDIVKAQLISRLEDGHYADACAFLNPRLFPLPQEVLQSAEVQNAAKRGLISVLQGGDPLYARKLLDAFPLPQEVVQDTVKAQLISFLHNGETAHIRELLEEFPLPEEVLQSAEVQIAVKEGGPAVVAWKHRRRA